MEDKEKEGFLKTASKKEDNDIIVKTAKKEEHIESSAKMVIEFIMRIVIAGCLALASWALYSAHSLYIDVAVEQTIRKDKDEEHERMMKEYKSDMEKRLSADKTESDRRFNELNKQLENINTKLDNLLSKGIKP